MTEAKGSQAFGDLFRRKEELKGFPCCGYASGERIMSELFQKRERCARKAVVEDNDATGGCLGDKRERRGKTFFGEIGYDAEPSEDSCLCGIVTRGLELLPEL